MVSDEARNASSSRTAALLVALLGNPNTGKSTLFNALSGLRQRVGNYPGVTVEKRVGTFRDAEGRIDLIDLPGTYSLAPRSPDEMLTADVLFGSQFSGDLREPIPDVLLSVVDATNLERNLYLTTQLLDVGKPVVIALTMIDSARRQGLTLDAVLLSERLGVPVIPVNAPHGDGLTELKQALRQAARSQAPQPAPTAKALAEEAERLQNRIVELIPALRRQAHLTFFAQRLLIDVGGYLEKQLTSGLPELSNELRASRQRLKELGVPVPGAEAKARYAWIREKAAGCVIRGPAPVEDRTAKIDAALTHRVWGLLLFLGVMFLVFQSIFTWARPLMDAIDAGKSWVGGLLAEHIPSGPLRSLLIQGILEGVGGVLVFLPQIMILFGFIAVLEDCGYMARAAFLMDKLMSRCGLSGKSFIPLLSSFACAIPGIMAARVIEDRRDRFATILIAPLMSCSARLPVYLLLAGAFLGGYGWWAPGLCVFAMYLLGLIAAPLVALVLKRTALRGETPVFLLEMPPYKWPSWRLILHRMVDRGWAFVYRAGTIILASMVLVWALLYFPAHDAAGVSYEARLARMAEQEAKLAHRIEALPKTEMTKTERETLSQARADVDAAQKRLLEEWRTNSCLGRLGRWAEPAVRPLGWDWRIGMAALASFPAREVVVGTLGIIYAEGETDAGDEEARASLGEKLKAARWDAGSPRAGQPVFSVPVALSLMVFFVFCCQCASTLAVLKRETNSWRWPAFAFTYMTILAYVAAFAVYQVGRFLS